MDRSQPQPTDARQRLSAFPTGSTRECRLHQTGLDELDPRDKLDAKRATHDEAPTIGDVPHETLAVRLDA
jgi:hypothetical protein